MRQMLSIAVLAFALSAAGAQPAAAQSGNAATISKDGTCGGGIPDADGGFTGFISTGQLVSVTTSGGNATLMCHFDIPAGLEPATATHAEGFTCGIPGGTTTDSRITASPGGSATLICKINKKSS
jgi:hypothetical protein